MLSNPIMQILGYFFFISPPKAREIIKNQPINGELENLPIWFVVLLEGLIRICLLLIISTVIQEFFLGKNIYEAMELDICFAVISIVGFFHFTVYYIFSTNLLGNKSQENANTIYRLFRNLGYAILSGLPIYSVGFFCINQGWIPSENQDLLFLAIVSVICAFALAGIFEAFKRERRPLGLDEII